MRTNSSITRKTVVVTTTEDEDKEKIQAKLKPVDDVASEDDYSVGEEASEFKVKYSDLK